MTCIVSSWVFPENSWENAVFGDSDKFKPIAFDHGCLLPFVAVFSGREGGREFDKEGGYDVWVSGQKDSIEEVAKCIG